MDLWDLVDDDITDFTDLEDSMTDFVCVLCTVFDVLTDCDFTADETFTDCSTTLDAESFTEKKYLYIYSKYKKNLIPFSNENVKNIKGHLKHYHKSNLVSPDFSTIFIIKKITGHNKKTNLSKYVPDIKFPITPETFFLLH